MNLKKIIIIISALLIPLSFWYISRLMRDVTNIEKNVSSVEEEVTSLSSDILQTQNLIGEDVIRVDSSGTVDLSNTDIIVDNITILGNLEPEVESTETIMYSTTGTYDLNDYVKTDDDVLDIVSTYWKIPEISYTYFENLSGSQLLNINASELYTGTVPTSRLSGIYGHITGLDTVSFSGDVTLDQNELKLAVLENSIAFPSSPVEGQMFWNPNEKSPYWYSAEDNQWKTGKDAATIIVAASDSKNKYKADYICDGTADEVQIQAAIDDLPSQGGKVILLEGTFQISEAIDKRSNLIIEGQGRATSLISQNRTRIFFALSDTTESNITLRDFYLDGNGSEDTERGGSPICFQRVENFLAENIYVYEGAGHGIRVTDNSENGIIRNCTVKETWDDCFSTDGDDIYDIVISESIAINPLPAWSEHSSLAQSAFEVDDGPENVIVTDSIAKFDGDGRVAAVHHHEGEASPKNITFDSIVTYGTFYMGIEILGEENVTVNNCRLSDGTVGIDIEDLAKNIKITNNHLESLSTAAVRIPAGDDPESIIISGNSITDTDDASGAINLNAGNDILVSNNIVKDVPRALRATSLSELNITDNYLEATGTTGSYTIYTSSVTNLSIEDNFIGHDSTTATHGAIYINGNAKVIGNIISAGWGGIIIGGSDNFEIKDNTIQAQRRPIEFLAGTNHNISSNRITQYSEDSITDYCIKFNAGDDHVVTHNTLDGWRGVRFVDGSTSNIFSYNHVTNVNSLYVYPYTTCLVLKGNIGYKTESSGEATITTGNVNVTVPHGLTTTPTRIIISPITDTAGKRYWVSSRDSSNFLITIDSTHTSDISFDWKAEVGEGN